MTQAQPASSRVVRFGDVEVDLRTGEIHRAGRRILLAEQPHRILQRLLARPGDAVTRDELHQELWPDNTFVDFEHGLNSAIKRLRDALGDSADAPRYVETLPRRGYRFIAPLEHGDTIAPSSDPSAEAVARSSASSPSFALSGPLLLLCVSTLAAWLGLSRSLPSNDIPAGAAGTPAAGLPLVAVADLENGTDDEGLDPLGRLTAGRLIRAISRIESAAVIPQPIEGGVDATNGVGDATVAAARRAGATLLVSGAYYARGDDLEFQTRIVDAASGRLLYSAPPVTGSRLEHAAALEALEQSVAGAVAIHFDYAFGGLEITSEPPLLDAYLEYVAGRMLFERDYPRLLTHFMRALAISPDFVLARLTLAMAYDNLGDTSSVSGEMARIAERADRLTIAERLLFEYLSDSLAHRPVDALRALEELEKIAPRSWIVNYSTLMEALILNRPQLTIDAFDRLPLHDRNTRFNAWRLDALARALHDLGDPARELTEVRRAQAYDPGNLRFVASETRALAALGLLEEITRLVDRSLSMPSVVLSPGGVMEYASRELLAHGHEDMSVKIAARAVDWYRARSDGGSVPESDRAALGRVLYLSGRWNESEEAFAALAAEHPASVDYTGYLGALAARQGRRQGALAISERLQTMAAPDLFGRHTTWRACIAALLGDHQRAVDLLREAVREGQSLGLALHQNPHLHALRGYAPFAELLRPAGAR